MMCPFFMLFPAVEIYLVLINNYLITKQISWTYICGAINSI